MTTTLSTGARAAAAAAPPRARTAPSPRRRATHASLRRPAAAPLSSAAPRPRRHVILPKHVAKNAPKGRLLQEQEWRGLGVQQSRGWVHYAVHRPEQHILLFRRPNGTDPTTGLVAGKRIDPTTGKVL